MKEYDGPTTAVEILEGINEMSTILRRLDLGCTDVRVALACYANLIRYRNWDNMEKTNG